MWSNCIFCSIKSNDIQQTTYIKLRKAANPNTKKLEPDIQRYFSLGNKSDTDFCTIGSLPVTRLSQLIDWLFQH